MVRQMVRACSLLPPGTRIQQYLRELTSVIPYVEQCEALYQLLGPGPGRPPSCTAVSKGFCATSTFPDGAGTGHSPQL